MQDMYLSRLFYASTATENFNALEFSKILAAGRKNNAALGVTGTLCYENNYFLGCLEGERANINLIFNKIADDPRHSELQLLELREIGSRYFEQYLTIFDTRGIVEHVVNASGIREFNPYLLDGESLTRAFRNVVETPEATLRPKPKRNALLGWLKWS